MFDRSQHPPSDHRKEAFTYQGFDAETELLF